MDRKSLTMMFFHFQDSKVHCNCCEPIEIFDLMAVHADQRVMIYCKFLRFLQASDFSHQ